MLTSEDAYNADPHGRHMTFVGTGFLAGTGVVLTNRHVVRDLELIRERNNKSREALRLMFLSFPAFDNVVVSLVPVRTLEMLSNPSIDIGILYVDASDPALQTRVPLLAAEEFDGGIGDAVSCLGYPLGEHALMRDTDEGQRRIYRFGPVLQQGFISAIAPFADAGVVERLLLDLRTEVGMSGSPIVRNSDGVLLGVHDAGRDMATSYAIPLSAAFVRALLEGPRSELTPDSLEWTVSPDFPIPKVRRAPRPA